MISIGVSGINATDNPGPGIPIAKCLKQSSGEYRMIGLGYSANDPGHYLSQYLDTSCLVPWPTRGWQGIKEKLLKIKDEVGLDIIIPSLDSELPLYIKYQQELSEHGIKCLLPTEEQLQQSSKVNLADLCESLDIKHPESKAVFSLKELAEKAKNFTYPFWVKGPLYKAYKVFEWSQVVYHFNQLFEEWGGADYFAALFRWRRNECCWSR